jgi:DNA polymerase III subunit beta
MKILTLAENFKKGIMIVEKIVGKNLTLPILSNVLIEAERGSLRASATNLEIGVVCNLRAKVEKEGRIAVPARILGSFLGGIPDSEKINIELRDLILNISYKGNKAAIKGMDAKDFPLIPKPQAEGLVELDVKSFRESILKTAVCVAPTETRQELTGIYMQFSKNKLILAATDSFRLAECAIDLEKERISKNYEKFVEKTGAVIVPARTLQEVARSALDVVEGGIKLYMGESQIFFESDDMMYVSRLIDGKYPEYKQVIPKEFSSSLILGKEEFLRAVKTASIFSDARSREIRIKVKSGEKNIQVSAQSVEAGENTSDVAADTNVKNSLEIAFNNRYLIDGINSISTDLVYLGFNDSFGPVALKEVGKEGKIDEKNLHIIMPIRS